MPPTEPDTKPTKPTKPPTGDAGGGRTTPPTTAPAAAPPATSTIPTTAPGFPDPTIMAQPERDPRDPSPNPMPRGARADDAVSPAGIPLEQRVLESMRGLDVFQEEIRGQIREIQVQLAELGDRRGNAMAAAPAPPKPDARGKLLAHIAVHENDSPEDIVERVREVRRGKVPLGMAKRFRTTARINAITTGSDVWPMAKRLKESSLPLGFEFDADEMPEAARQHFFEAGAIEAIE